MTMTDPIADMLTRVRNAHQGYKDEVKMPSVSYTHLTLPTICSV